MGMLLFQPLKWIHTTMVNSSFFDRQINYYKKCLTKRIVQPKSINIYKVHPKAQRKEKKIQMANTT